MEKLETSDLLCSNFNLNKFSTTEVEFNDLFADRCKLRKVKSGTVGMKIQI